ncbi:AAA family ATPase [Actinomycetes bacterium KLBMP 9759]
MTETDTDTFADQLRRARRRRFVGRRRELDVLRGALAGHRSFSVMYLHGPGGVGKSALLDVLDQEAKSLGATALLIDGHQLGVSPDGVAAALTAAMPDRPADPVAALRSLDRPLLLVDGYEELTGIDDWFRKEFLASLPAGVLVVIASRTPPATRWLSDPAWRDLLQVARLENLSPSDALDYLSVEDVPEPLRPGLVELSHGHPLTLSLMVDWLRRHGPPVESLPSHLGELPEVVRALMTQVMDPVPSDVHQAALDVAAHARYTTEGLLRSVLGEAVSRDLFAWLRTLSFIEEGPFGLYPTELVRDALEADRRWRDGDGYAELHRSVRSYLLDNVRKVANDRETQRRIMDAVHVARTHPIFGSRLRWPAVGSAPHLDRVHADDRSAMLQMTEWHHGPEQAALLDHWLTRQPEAFRVYRSGNGTPHGFGAYLALHDAAEADIAIDPGASAMWAFARRAGPPRPGESVMAWRFLVDNSPTGLSPVAATLAATARVEAGLNLSRWAWDLVGVTQNAEHCEPLMSYLDFGRAVAADYTVGGRTYAVFAHDWRLVGVKEWLEITAARELGEPVDPPPVPGGHVLSEAEFAAAVRTALQDLHITERLATSPLVRSQLVRSRGRSQVPEAALRGVLMTAIDLLREDPRWPLLHQVADRAFLRPGQTQEQAAAALQLSLSTFRRHRDRAVQRITEWMWQGELAGVAAQRGGSEEERALVQAPI